MTEAGPELRPLLWSAGVLLAAVALHVDRLPPWCTLVILGLAGWRIALALRRRPPPGAVLRTAIAVLLLVSVAFQFSGVSGLAGGSALLAGMGALKLLETRARRDHFVVIGVSLFLVVAACLDRQGLPRLPLYVAVTWLVCTAMAIVGTPRVPLATRAAMSIAGRALALSLPLAIALFVLFPRVQGQVWALPGSGAGVTGLSNEMSPGAISELTTAYDPAFRARFFGRPPPARELYWRGPVLQGFDGYTWRREPRSIYRQSPLRYLGPGYRYRVTLEPHQRNWWFALDLPTASPDRAVRFTWDYMLVSDQPVRQPVSYEARSHTAVRATEPLTPLQRRLALQLPPGRNPRSVALGRQLRAQTADDAAFVQALLGLFRDGGYAYTLTPPKLDLDSVDDFLFNTRRGFCGHYASAFATLARAAGIPARVVTGYQGGEWNPIGAYFIVRQSDAHAWAEVWLEERGWSRVDPTGVVAPERLDRGFFEALPGAVSTADRMLREIGWLADARLAWDTLNTWWKDEVVEFDLGSQLSLLSRLGFDSPRLSQLGALLAGAVLAWVGWILLRFGRMERRRDADPLARAWRRLGERLAAAGAAREPSEGPLDFAARLRATRPVLAGRVGPLLEQYARLRYGPGLGPAAAEVTAFARAARAVELREGA
jgi:transglutaminase-like putative cysteine protease